MRALLAVSTHVVELNGAVSKDGTMELTGTAAFASETTRDFDVAITVTRFSAAPALGSGMAGSISYELRANQANSEFLVATLAGDTVNANRSDLTLFTSTPQVFGRVGPHHRRGAGAASAQRTTPLSAWWLFTFCRQTVRRRDRTPPSRLAQLPCRR